MKLQILSMIVALALLTFCASAEDADVREVRKLLGDDANGAKIVATRGDEMVTLDLWTLRTDVVVGKDDLLVKPGKFTHSRPWWSPDGREILRSSGGKAFVYTPDGRRRRIMENVKEVHEPIWWLDPQSGHRCVVYKTGNSKNGLRRGRGATYLYDLQTGKQRKLIDMTADGGLSLDGSHLGEAYASAAIIDLTENKVHKVHPRQACNGTMSPDNTYRMMYLYLPHDTFGIRNKYGKELWKIRNPRGSKEWQTPRWSNHPDFCAAVARFGSGYKPVIVHIPSKKMVVLKQLEGSWRVPHLWLPSAARGLESPSPIDHLKLTELEGYRKKVSRATCYTPILRELARSDSPEARRIIEALEALGERKLAEAKRADDPSQAAAVYRETADLFAGHAIGKQAEKAMTDPDFRKELAASEELRLLRELVSKLRPVRKAKARFDDKKYFQVNQAVLVKLVKLVGEIRSEHPGTRAASEAGALSERLQLPEATEAEDNRKCVVRATVLRTSTVLTPKQIAPYKEALTYIRWKVEKVLEGKCESDEIVVVHWLIRDRKHTDVARLEKGDTRRLALDLFDSHPKIARTLASSDEDDFDKTPWFALKMEKVEDK